jgi:hypothetical protein
LIVGSVIVLLALAALVACGPSVVDPNDPTDAELGQEGREALLLGEWVWAASVYDGHVVVAPDDTQSMMSFRPDGTLLLSGETSATPWNWRIVDGHLEERGSGQVSSRLFFFRDEQLHLQEDGGGWEIWERR